MVDLHEVSPREQSGRDTFSRYKAQAKSAGLASLEILDNSDIDKIYCEWHDDYVIRKVNDGVISYNFIQVKTNRRSNYQWSLNELFGFSKQKKTHVEVDKKLKDSFIGKLLLHTVIFDRKCEKVTFLTNVHIKNEVYDILEAIDNNEFSNKYIRLLFDNFQKSFSSPSTISDLDIKEKISKLSIDTDVEHIKDNDETFEAIAHRHIFKYSEIELSVQQANDIMHTLISLVEKKSIGILPDLLSEEELTSKAAITLSDLLDVLSISKKAYEILSSGGDNKALKNASILHRLLDDSGISENSINYAAECKISWDEWYRKNRHEIPDFYLFELEEKISEAICSCLNNKTIELKKLIEPTKRLSKELSSQDFFKDLDETRVLGAFLSNIVKAQ